MRRLGILLIGGFFLAVVGSPRFGNADPGERRASVMASDVAISSYSMDVRIFPESHLLKVKARVGVTSKRDGVAQLGFRLRDEFKVERITQAGRPLEFRQDNWDIRAEGVEVGRNSPPMVWEYEGTFKPPFKSDSMEDVIVYGDEIRLTRSSHWYPEAGWLSGLGIKGSSRLSVEVPDGFIVVSGDGFESAPEPHDGRIVYRYGSRTYGGLSFAAARYAKTSIPWGDKTVEGYFFAKKPGDESKLRVTKLVHEEKDVLETLRVAKNVLDFYSRKFCSYPWNKFSLVQKSNYAAYAYGVQTYVVMNNLCYVSEKAFAHELAHQWWGNLIHPVGEGERWLTESLAEYSAFLYMEHVHGKQDRVTDGREFLLGEMRNVHPIRKSSFNTPNYDNIFYHIGPHVFHMLRYVVGDEQFSEIVQTFAEGYAHKDATVDDLVEVAEGVHEKSLDWFFEQWLERTRNPAFVLQSESIEQEDGVFVVKGTITQHNTDYRMPLEIEIFGEGEREKHRIWVEADGRAFEYRVGYKPLQVKFSEEMGFWILADFFSSEEERLAAAEKRPKPRPHRGKEELIALIRNNIKFERSYEPGTEIELALGEKEAARLKLAENPSGVREILICPMDGALSLVRLYDDGGSSIGGKSLTDGEAFNYTRAANIAVWEIEGDKVRIKFRAETDREKIKGAFKERFEKKGLGAEETEKRLKQLFPE